MGSRTSVLFDAPRDHDDDQGKVCSTTSSSSIGRNSDDDDDEVSSERSMDENEAESKYNGGALDCMEALEEVLPIR